MRTTLAINEKLLDEAKELSGARTKKETVEIALDEFIRRRKTRKLLDLEGKVEFLLRSRNFSTEGKKMFLIDSSVWIEYLMPNGAKRVKDKVRDILGKDDAATCGIMVVEILRGATAAIFLTAPL